MKSLGWCSPFVERTWNDTQVFLDGVNWDQRPDYLFEIVDSVVSAGADRVLAVTTSMHDLVITLKPVGDPPNDVVIVRAPGSLNPAEDGNVRIDRLEVSGRTTTIQRPVGEALRLFWRFIETEYGIGLDRLGRSSP